MARVTQISFHLGKTTHTADQTLFVWRKATPTSGLSYGVYEEVIPNADIPVGDVDSQYVPLMTRNVEFDVLAGWYYYIAITGTQYNWLFKRVAGTTQIGVLFTVEGHSVGSLGSVFFTYSGVSSTLHELAFNSDTPYYPAPVSEATDVSPVTEWLSWIPAYGMMDQRILFDFASGTLSHQLLNQIVGYTDEIDPTTGRSYVNIKNIFSDLQWPLYRQETFKWRVDTKFSEEGGYEIGPEWNFTTPNYPTDLQPWPAIDAVDVRANIPYLGITVPSDAKTVEFWRDSVTFAVEPFAKLREIEITDAMRQVGTELTIMALRDNWSLPDYFTWPLTGRQTDWHVRVHYNSK